MSQELPDRPERGRRRPKAAPDENIDPIDSPRSTTADAVTPAAPPKIVREPFNARLDPKVIELLHQARSIHGIKIYEAVEQAVKAHWGNPRE